MRTTVDLPPDLHSLTRSLARDQGRSMSAVIVDLLRKGAANAPADSGRNAPRTRAGIPLLDLPRAITTDDVLRSDDA